MKKMLRGKLITSVEYGKLIFFIGNERVPMLYADDYLQELQHEITLWSDKTFGPKTIIRMGGIINHLTEEIVEYSEEENQTRRKGEELADIGILLLDLLAGIGIKDNLASILSPLLRVDYDLYARMCKKHKINLKRVWDKKMEGGRIKHGRSPRKSTEEEKNQGSEKSHDA